MSAISGRVGFSTRLRQTTPACTRADCLDQEGE
jgi:hypothetical protein